MTKLWIASDHHLPISQARCGCHPDDIPADADVAVIAGDVTDDIEAAFGWLAPIAKRLPIVYALGNHEFHGTSIEQGRALARQLAQETGVTLLDNDSAMVEGVYFLGGTGWTDFGIWADRPGGIREAMLEAKRSGFPEFNGDVTLHPPCDGMMAPILTPKSMAALNREFRAAMTDALAFETDAPRVLVSHYAPHPSSVDPHHADSPLTAAYVFDMPVLDHPVLAPDLVIHGHTHTCFDYETAAGCRVLCNPLGVPLFPVPGSRRDLVVNVQRRCLDLLQQESSQEDEDTGFRP